MTPEQRFMDKVVKAPSGCWIWTAYIGNWGYGIFRYEGEPVLAQRAAYLMFVGPIPDGHVVDHLCRVRRCVNPMHLEAVLFRTNVIRGTGPTAINARKATCSAGHVFDEENTYLKPNGGRDCRACIRERVRRYAAKRKARA